METMDLNVLGYLLIFLGLGSSFISYRSIDPEVLRSLVKINKNKKPEE